jgi:hypothetical protein
VIAALKSKRCHSNPNIILAIYDVINSVPLKMTIVWVPSHIGISGNERVDALAKASAERFSVDIHPTLEISDISGLNTDYINNEFQATWDAASRKYHAAHPAVTDSFSFGNTSRSEQVTLTRLVMGRCRLNYPLFKMGLHPSGLCDRCGVPETVQHYLVECAGPVAVAIRDHIAQLSPPRSNADYRTWISDPTIPQLILINNKAAVNLIVKKY